MYYYGDQSVSLKSVIATRRPIVSKRKGYDVNPGEGSNKLCVMLMGTTQVRYAVLCGLTCKRSWEDRE
jgi:hypothetical protein